MVTVEYVALILLVDTFIQAQARASASRPKRQS
jgi:hypothetical protein